MLKNVKTLLLACISIGCSSSEGGWQFYRIAAVDEAQGRNLPIALHIDDDSCRAQRTSLNEIIKNEEFEPIRAFRAQASKEARLLRTMRLEPCTLVVMKGSTELTRLQSTSDKQSLKEALEMAVKK